MSVTINKPISKLKELFLAICLLSGEISQETIRKMKEDYGETAIKNNVIQSLKIGGYIKRYKRKDVGYGYQLTPKGVEYMKTKLPDRYDYNCYSDSKARKYDDNVRFRNLTSSYILYYLARSGVDLTNHEDDMRSIFSFQAVEVEKPFFVTVKQMRRLHLRFRMIYGYRVYGWIITRDAFWAVYLHDSEHPICLSREESFHVAMGAVREHMQPPYSANQNYRFLYLYRNESEYIKSFNGFKGYDTKTKFTVSMYQEYRLKKSAACIMSKSCNELLSILDDDVVDRINQVFFDEYELTHAPMDRDCRWFSYLYEGTYRTAICPYLSPTTIVEALLIFRPFSEDDVVLLCFDDSFELLQTFFRRRRLEDRIHLAWLSRKDVMQYISDYESQTE